MDTASEVLAFQTSSAGLCGLEKGKGSPGSGSNKTDAQEEQTLRGALM